MWNSPPGDPTRRRGLYEVGLGCGDPAAGQWLTISTVLKTPRVLVGEGGTHATGPTGFTEALTSAMFRLEQLDFAGPAVATSTPGWDTA
jgi:hypothetical protein